MALMFSAINPIISFADSGQSKVYEPFEVKIGSGEAEQNYVIMNNSFDTNQWYAAKLAPKIYEYRETPKADLEPALYFYRFQKIDSKKPDKVINGAYFECTFDMGVDDKTLKELVNKLPKEIDKKRVRFSALPIDMATLSILNPKKGKSKKTKETFDFTASSSVSLGGMADLTKVKFFGTLTDDDVPLFASLLEGHSGVPYRITYNYNILSELQKQSVTMNYNKKQVSINQDFLNGRLKSFLLSRAKNPKLLQVLREKEYKNKADSHSKPKEIDVRDIGHREKTSAKKQNSKLDEFVENFTFYSRNREKKVLVAEGFISLDTYSEAVKNKKIQAEVVYDQWNTACLSVPAVSDDEDLGIDNIILNIELKVKNLVYESKKITWTRNSGWLDSEKRPVYVLRFPLNDIAKLSEKDPLSEAVFDIKADFSFKNASPLCVEFKEKAINGSLPITNPIVLYEVAQFDFTSLFWDKANGEERLIKVEVLVKDGSRTIKRTVEPKKFSANTLVYPERLYIAISENSFSKGDLKAKVVFHTSKNRLIPWIYNDMKLNQYFDTPDFLFIDDDWENQPYK